MNIGFLLLDDYEIVRKGIRNILKQKYPDSIILDCGDVDNAIKIIRSHPFNFLFLDLSIPHLEPSSFVRNVVSEFTGLNIIVLSSLDPRLYANHLYKLGIKAYLHKNEVNQSEIFESIEVILNNKIYFTKYVSEILALQNLGITEQVHLAKLSTRELFILDNLKRGKTIKEIANELSISYSVTGRYKIEIFKKLNISSIIELNE